MFTAINQFLMKTSKAISYSCVILDQDPIDIKIMEIFIQEISKLECLAGFTDFRDAIELINAYQRIDFLFIDLRVVNFSMNVARTVRAKCNFIVFLTEKNEFNLKVFESGDASLVKPVDFNHLLETINKLIKRNRSQLKLASADVGLLQEVYA